MENIPEPKREEDPNVREARHHARTAREEIRRSVEAWFPPGVAQHSRAARREFLLAVRSMVNAAIDRIEKIDREEPARGSSTDHPISPV